MSFDKKMPSVRVILTKDEYNKLIELMVNVEIESLKKVGEDIKNKLLIYSEIKDKNIILRLFPSQVGDALKILINNCKDVSISNNYYEILLNNKKKYQKQIEKEKEKNDNE